MSETKRPWAIIFLFLVAIVCFIVVGILLSDGVKQ